MNKEFKLHTDTLRNVGESPVMEKLFQNDRERREFSAEVALRDPIGLDDRIALLHAADAAGNIAAVRGLVSESIDTFSRKVIDPVIALAALRDFDVMVGIGVRKGLINPAELDGRFPDVLLTCAAVAETVPRGTIYGYTSANPIGPRMRTYTTDPREVRLIQYMQEGGAGLGLAHEAIMEAFAVDFQDSPLEATDLLREVQINTKPMIAAVANTIRDVGAEFFTMDLSQYMHPALIGGQRIGGPSPANMPVAVLDHVLYGLDMPEDDIYWDYLRSRLPYFMPNERNVLEGFSGPTIQRKMGAISPVVLANSPAHQSLAQEISSLGLILRKFRYPHARLADDALVAKGKPKPEDDVNALLKLQNLATETWKRGNT